MTFCSLLNFEAEHIVSLMKTDTYFLNPYLVELLFTPTQKLGLFRPLTNTEFAFFLSLVRMSRMTTQMTTFTIYSETKRALNIFPTKQKTPSCVLDVKLCFAEIEPGVEKMKS